MGGGGRGGRWKGGRSIYINDNFDYWLPLHVQQTAAWARFSIVGMALAYFLAAEK